MIISINETSIAPPKWTSLGLNNSFTKASSEALAGSQEGSLDWDTPHRLVEIAPLYGWKIPVNGELSIVMFYYPMVKWRIISHKMAISHLFLTTCHHIGTPLNLRWFSLANHGGVCQWGRHTSPRSSQKWDKYMTSSKSIMEDPSCFLSETIH